MRDPVAADRVHVDIELPLELRPPFGVATAWSRILRAGPLRTSPASWARSAVIAAIALAACLEAREDKDEQANNEERAQAHERGDHPERSHLVGSRGAARGVVE
jgi:hypothetical protein